MEGSGGLSVSDLLEQHSRTNIPRPIPPGQSDSGPQRGAAPEPSGRRAAPEPPAHRSEPQGPESGRQQGDHAHRPAQEPPQGRRRAAHEPEDDGQGPSHSAAPVHSGEAGPRAGRRARPEPSAHEEETRYAAPVHGEPDPAVEAAGGRRARHDEAPSGRRAAPEEPQTGRRAAPEADREAAAPEGVSRASRRARHDEPAPSGRRSAPEEGVPAHQEEPGPRSRQAPGEGAGRRSRATAPEDGFAEEGGRHEPAARRGRSFTDEAPWPQAADRRRPDARGDEVADAPAEESAARLSRLSPGEPTGRRSLPPHGAEADGRGQRGPGPDATGRRARPDAGPQGPDATGRRARPEVDGGPRGPQDGPRRPGPDGPVDGPRRPGPELGDGPRGPRRPGPDGTGTRPRPMPGDGPGMPGPDGPDGTGSRPRPMPGDGFDGRPPGLPEDGPRRGPDGTGMRPRPIPGDGPGLPEDGPRRGQEGTGVRPRPMPGDGGPMGPGPDGPGPRSRPVPPDGSSTRMPRPIPEDGPRRGPEGTGTRPRPVPGDGPARLAGHDGPPPGPPGGPRRPGPEGSSTRMPRPMPGEDFEDGFRGLPEDGPRRGPEGTGMRPRPIPGDGPGLPEDGPRRLAPGDGPMGPEGRGPEGRGPEGTGMRPRPVPPGDDRQARAESFADGDAGRGPRRLAPESGRQGPHDGPPSRFAEDNEDALPLPPPGVPALGGPPPGPGGPEPREQIDPASLTTEMEAISDDIKKLREVDHTLARFSAVHDELAEQERQRKERRQKLMPWKSEVDEDATEYAEPVDPEDPDDPDADSGGKGKGKGRKGRTAKQSKIVRIIKAISLTSAVVVFLASGIGWGAMLHFDSKITRIDALGQNSAAVHEAEKQLGDENFLIIGSDTRAGAKDSDGVGDTSEVVGARSDVMMIAHVPADRKRMVVVSMPRDLQVTRPACNSWDSASDTYSDKVLPEAEGVKANEVYATGGPQCVSKFMTQLSGLDINRFVSVDFNGFKGMVDAVGTVGVCVPSVMDDGELGMIFDKPGKYDINGQKALDYVRARKVKTEEFGDYDRIKRQQQFLSALLRKAMSSELLLSPTKLNGFLNAFASSTAGQNIGVDSMLTLAQSLQGLDAGRVSFVTVPHSTDEGPTPSNDDNFEVLQEDETKALFQAVIDGTPLPGESPSEGGTTEKKAEKQPGTVLDPGSVRVQVFNQTSGGYAPKNTKTKLEEVGFKVAYIGVADQPSTRTFIRYATGNENAAATLRAAVPDAELQVDESMGGAVALMMGSGWEGAVEKPQAGQSGGVSADSGSGTGDLPVVNAAVDPCA
ncbi:transcriptional attenuator, LytR family [Actinosynnema pretiosum]|nr:transcriptional attenuator, LytR family [Actinosynnema pretiosum]